MHRDEIVMHAKSSTFPYDKNSIYICAWRSVWSIETDSGVNCSFIQVQEKSSRVLGMEEPTD